ncbi:hypothetical protein EDC04DRAFT_894342 [Pisolithus marmoratus]|nr:hypothetical protein EDC04DRAFT_894342 [Pisolithus marmoratus]
MEQPWLRQLSNSLFVATSCCAKRLQQLMTSLPLGTVLAYAVWDAELNGLPSRTISEHRDRSRPSTEMPTAGLQDATLINAVTFTAQCHSFPDVTTVANASSYNITVSYENGREVIYDSFHPLYENVTYAVDARGKTVTILTTPPILDARRDSGSTFDVPSPVVDYHDVHFMVINQTAVINVQTNALMNITPTPSPTNSAWTPPAVRANRNLRPPFELVRGSMGIVFPLD